MIIYQIDVRCPPFGESKDDPPVVRTHRHSPISFQIAFQPVQPECVDIHVLDFVGRIRRREDQPKPSDLIRR